MTTTRPPWTTLVGAEALREHIAAQRPLVLLDCGFDLADVAAGGRDFAAGHLPGAQHAHLERDLSGAKAAVAGAGNNGRHPLPGRAAFAATACAFGVTPGVQVVAYDRQGGLYAARAWWLLRWLGHRAVAVLDGGVAAWQQAGGSLDTGTATPPQQPPYPAAAEPAMPTVDAATLLQSIGPLRVLDARAAERFRGDVEPLDAVAGHIPGASNRFYRHNLAGDGRFKPAAALRAEFDAFGAAAADVVHQCGSGVTACHNLLAMEHAGLDGSRLYPGSWSEWCSDPARPVARG